MNLKEPETVDLMDALPVVPLNRAPWVKLHQLHNWAERSGMAILDQGCISGGNFLLYILLARWLTPSEYGIFAIAFSIYMFLLGLHTGLIQEPMAVLGHVAYGQDLRGYCSRLLRIHLLFSGALAVPLVGVGACLVWVSRGQFVHLLGVALLSLGISLPLLLMLWLARRMAYLHLVPRKAAFHAVLYLLLLLLGIAAIRATQNVSVAAAFAVMALASLIVGSVLLAKLGALRCSSSGISEVFRKHLEFGKWLVAMAVFAWLARDAYYVLAAGMIGPAEAGALRAVGNLATPLEQTQTALIIMLLPWLSSLCARGLQQRLLRRTLQVTVALVMMSLVYLLMLWPLASRVLNIAYQGKYSHFAWMVPWLILPQVLRACASGGLLYLMVTQRTRQLFYAGAGAGLVTIMGALLVHWWLLRGAVCGLLLNAVASSFLVLVFWRFGARGVTRQIPVVTPSLEN